LPIEGNTPDNIYRGKGRAVSAAAYEAADIARRIAADVLPALHATL
jgi:hypothetical protein